jgi:hypothetical protein
MRDASCGNRDAVRDLTSCITHPVSRAPYRVSGFGGDSYEQNSLISIGNIDWPKLLTDGEWLAIAIKVEDNSFLQEQSRWPVP